MTIDDKALRLPAFLFKPVKMSYAFRYRAHRRALEEIIRNNRPTTPGARPGPLIIFPPSLNWHSQLFQRPQQLAVALAKQGALVFYIQAVNRTRATAENPNLVLEQISERLYLCSIPVGAFWFLKNPITYLLTWNAKYIAAFSSPRVIYDVVDEIQAFEGNPDQMIRRHQELLQRAEWVLTTAERLYKKVLQVRQDVILCPNGVDYDFFYQTKDQTTTPPPDILPILALNKPIIGYYGALAHWFDFDLLKAVANMRNDLSFILIGPEIDGSLQQSQALQLSNIHWLGVRSYMQIPQYLRCFDAAMIPFHLNDVTHATSPLKLFEYMAGGRPVVITAMEESLRFPGVIVANEPADFAHKLDQALQLRFDHNYLQLIDQVAQHNTWEIRAQQIFKALAMGT